MTPFLKEHFQCDEMPPDDIVRSAYIAATRVAAHPERFPDADQAYYAELIVDLEIENRFALCRYFDAADDERTIQPGADTCARVIHPEG